MTTLHQSVKNSLSTKNLRSYAEKIKLGKILGIFILLILAVIPSVNYFRKVAIFNIGGTNITIGFLILTAILAFSFILVLLGRLSYIPKLFILILLFVLWGTSVAIAQSVPIRWWLPPLLRWTGNLLIAILGYQFALKGYLTPRWFRAGLLVSLIAPLIMGVSEASLGLAPLLNNAYRVSSTFNESPLGYALFLSGVILLLLSAEKITMLYGMLLVLSLLMVISTYARLTLVALGVGIVFVLFFQRRFKMVFLLGLLILPFFLFTPSITEQIVERFSGLSLTGTDFLNIWREGQIMAYSQKWWRPDIDSSSLLRVKTLIIGLDFWKQSPIQGSGFGSFVPSYETATGQANVGAHNDYLLYLMETGIVGLILYIIIQIRIILGLLKKIKFLSEKTRLFVVSTAGAYLTVNILSFLSNSYYFYEIQLWIWLGIGMSFALTNLDLQSIPTHNRLRVRKICQISGSSDRLSG